jgi:hypothetical protein
MVLANPAGTLAARAIDHRPNIRNAAAGFHRATLV